MVYYRQRARAIAWDDTGTPIGETTMKRMISMLATGQPQSFTASTQTVTRGHNLSTTNGKSASIGGDTHIGEIGIGTRRVG